jgi:hypothetical protein
MEGQQSMEARFKTLASVLTVFSILAIAPPPAAIAAPARTQNFIVYAPTPQLAQQVSQAAENYRRELAIEWLGHELPAWSQPCPIMVKLDPGAGGRTSFMFRNRVPHGWEMEVQGTPERILDSVLPHEITHTIFATHFGSPLPRWADEGACTTVEHESERRKQHEWLIRFLKTQRGIPFNRMFAMTEYPSDILPLYSQGYSVARFLIAQGGKREFVQFIGTGLESNNWTAAVQSHYGYESLGNLQLAWVDWVTKGSREDLAGKGIYVVSNEAPRQPTRATPTSPRSETVALASAAASPSRRPRIDQPLPSRDSNTARPAERTATTDVGRSWYAR